MNNNAETFLMVGRWLLDFVLSLANVHPSDIEPKLYFIMNLIASIVVWVWVLRISIAIIKRISGFESPPRQ